VIERRRDHRFLECGHDRGPGLRGQRACPRGLDLARPSAASRTASTSRSGALVVVGPAATLVTASAAANERAPGWNLTVVSVSVSSAGRLLRPGAVGARGLPCDGGQLLVMCRHLVGLLGRVASELHQPVAMRCHLGDARPSVRLRHSGVIGSVGAIPLRRGQEVLLQRTVIGGSVRLRRERRQLRVGRVGRPCSVLEARTARGTIDVAPAPSFSW